MKAITICQPYADLCLLPFGDPRAKRTENRTWACGHRGPLLIHAGKSREWLNVGWDGIDEYGIEVKNMVFGAIIGIVEMIDCLAPDDVRRKYPVLKDHRHIEGPWCHVYAKVRRFVEPVPFRGAMGLFDAPDAFKERA